MNSIRNHNWAVFWPLNDVYMTWLCIVFFSIVESGSSFPCWYHVINFSPLIVTDFRFHVRVLYHWANIFIVSWLPLYSASGFVLALSLVFTWGLCYYYILGVYKIHLFMLLGPVNKIMVMSFIFYNFCLPHSMIG